VTRPRCLLIAALIVLTTVALGSAGSSASPRAAPPIKPVTVAQLGRPMKLYRTYVADQLQRVQGQVAALATDIANQDVAAAKAKWLFAHRSWLRIGQDDGAYSVFGVRGQAIDGTAAGLVKGTADPQFKGFHKVELDLWVNDDLKAAAHDTAHLLISVVELSEHGISRWFPLDNDSVIGLPLRCHEVLEDALRDSLSGNDDYGSGTSLASVRSDVTATREFLTLLHPLLARRAPHLVRRGRRELTRLDAALDKARHGTTWIPVRNLGRARREAINAAIGAALETLAPVPDLLSTGKS
jgi:high-affinity iron transporter